MTNKELKEAVGAVRDDVISANFIAMDLTKGDGISEERRNLILATLTKVAHSIDVILQEANNQIIAMEHQFHAEAHGTDGECPW